MVAVMEFDIEKRTIYRTLTGSRVYGTSTPESDYDYRGVCIPPFRYYYGFMHNFEQYQPSGEDTTIFALKKFMGLAAQNNPNILELLYIPQEFWITATGQWEDIVAQRALFLSKKCFFTYKGYSHNQLRRMRSHREWLMKGELKEPSRSDFGLPEGSQLPKEIIGAAHSLIDRNLRKYPIEEELSRIPKDTAQALRQTIHEFLEHRLALTKAEIEDTAWVSAGREIGLEANFLKMLQQEKAYQKARKEWKSWLHWKKERNPRRKEMEAKYSFDVKHALHLVRLLVMCKEILTEHTLKVVRGDAEMLMEIKRGEWSYDQLMEWEAQITAELDELYKTSTLQNSPRRENIDQLCISITEDYLRNNY